MFQTALLSLPEAGILGIIFFIFIIFLIARHAHRMRYLARGEYRTARGELKEIGEEESEEEAGEKLEREEMGLEREEEKVGQEEIGLEREENKYLNYESQINQTIASLLNKAKIYLRRGNLRAAYYYIIKAQNLISKSSKEIEAVEHLNTEEEKETGEMEKLSGEEEALTKKEGGIFGSLMKIGGKMSKGMKKMKRVSRFFRRHAKY